MLNSYNFLIITYSKFLLEIYKYICEVIKDYNSKWLGFGIGFFKLLVFF